jgi:hypothetical protein
MDSLRDTICRLPMYVAVAKDLALRTDSMQSRRLGVCSGGLEFGDGCIFGHILHSNGVGIAYACVQTSPRCRAVSFETLVSSTTINHSSKHADEARTCAGEVAQLATLPPAVSSPDQTCTRSTTPGYRLRRLTQAQGHGLYQSSWRSR